MAAHVCLKNEFTEDEKCHNLMNWLVREASSSNPHNVNEMLTIGMSQTAEHEPLHDKTNKMACAASEDSDQPGHPPSLIRVFAVRMMKALTLSYPGKTLIRLGGCPGWSESSLGAYAILLVLSRGGSVMFYVTMHLQGKSFYNMFRLWQMFLHFLT